MALGFVKTAVVITALLICGAGIATILVASISLRDSESQIFVGKAKTAKVIFFFNTLFFTDQNIFIISLIVIGTVLILFGLAGIYGALKRQGCFLTVYVFGIIILFLIFGAIGVAGILVFKNKWIPNLNDEISCHKQEWLDQLNSFELSARQYFCSSSCPCNMDSETLLKWQSTEYQQLFQPPPQPLVISPTGYSRIQDCPNLNYEELTDYDGDYIAAMAELEKHIHCSGICSRIDIYMFNDINAGLPYNGDCLGKIISYFKKYSREIGGICLGTAGVLLLNIIFSFCICCHKKRESQDPNEHLLKY